MNTANPYTLMFGKEPIQMISRVSESEDIYRNFLSEVSPQQVYMITGVRGSGKTVQMTEISKRIKEEENWIVLELNPVKDLLLDFAAKLYNEKKATDIIRDAKINLSFWGIGVEIAKSEKITDIEVALSRMLESLKKQNKRVLITIDEAVNSQTMREFASAFQIFIRQDLPLYLIMTGLYENIDALQNEQTLTFLHRAPKIFLKPLNIGSIVNQYKNTFHLDDENARKMAKLTRGYSFAFQVLGYFTFENNGDYKSIIDKYREYLDEYVYNKIWSGLSEKEKRIMYAIASSKGGKIIDIRELLNLKPNEFSPYRERLIKRGLINGDERGIVKFTLPCFENYVLNNYLGDDYE